MGTQQDTKQDTRQDSRDVVYDVEQDMDPTSPLDQLAAQIGQIMDSDRWLATGQGYAMGRLYSEISPLLDAAGEDVASDQDTALAFGVLYQRMMLDFRDRARPEVVALDVAWDSFYRSAGGSLDI